MAEYFTGLRRSLADIISQEKQAKLQRETPQYQLALQRFMNEKLQILQRQALLDELAKAPLEQIPIIAARYGQFGPLQSQQQQAAIGGRLEREYELKEEEDIRESRLARQEEEQKQAGRLQLRKIPFPKYITAREKVANSILAKWDQTKQSFSEFFNSLDQKEQNVLDRIFRSPNIYDLLGGFGNEGEQPELK